MTSNEVDVLRELYWCLLNKQPVPDHVSAAFIEKYLKGRNGEVRSWDAVFGRPSRFGTGERIKRQIEQGQLVVDEVAQLKASDGSLNEEAFEAVGRQTGVGAKSKVKELWHDARLWTERLNWLYRRD